MNVAQYFYYKLKIKQYPHKSSKMVGSYINLFKSLLENKDNIVSNRNLFRSPCLLYLISFFIFKFKIFKKFKLI